MAPKKLALKYLRAKNSFDLRSVASQTLKMTEKRILYTLLIFSCFAMIYGSTKSGKGLRTKIVEFIESQFNPNPIFSHQCLQHSQIR